MEITEVRIKLMEDSDDRLQAFCSITFDNAFVVRDLKIIDGANGPFVAMPSRKLTSHCHQCGCKNHLRAPYCNQCGSRLKEDRSSRDPDGRAKLYADIAHPINSACREMIQNRVISEFKTELERAKQPGYVSRYDDDYEMDFDALDHSLNAGPAPAPILAPPPVERLPAERPAPVAPVQEPTSEKTHIKQPAEAGPRGPHRTGAGQASHSQKKSNDQFGAGIF